VCDRCQKVRYCDAECQVAHWNRETNPHKEHCRAVVEASEDADEAGTAPPGGGGASSPTDDDAASLFANLSIT